MLSEWLRTIVIETILSFVLPWRTSFLVFVSTSRMDRQKDIPSAVFLSYDEQFRRISATKKMRETTVFEMRLGAFRKSRVVGGYLKQVDPLIITNIAVRLAALGDAIDEKFASARLS